MTTPSLYNPREATQIHLEIVDLVIETIQDTFPAAATLDCHRQMRDILIRIRDTLHHPVLFAAHIIVYLVKAVRYSRRWATLVKNIAALDPLLLKRRSSALSSQSSALTTQHSALSSQSSAPSSQSSLLNPQHSALRTQHSLQTRLRIRAFAQALQHERHIAQKLPPSIPKPDLTPILPVNRHPSILSPQSAIYNPQSSILSPQSSALSPFPPPPLFPSEAFWESKVRSLQLKILGNITRPLPAVYRAYLKQYNASLSSTPPTLSSSSTPSFQSHSSYSSHSSHPSHSSPPPVSTPQSAIHNPQSAILTPLSHPPPQHP